ncbi:MAG TPA: divalent metal cation transporter [Vicinamibacterales bacterium]|nr:divalent metal cation transporter [Vicinamibacterales bacterium]
MNSALKIALGVVTGIGGFLDAGTIATSAQAGARFQYRLLWVLALGTLCIIFISEMLGRLAAISKHTLADAIRERFGVRYHALPLVSEIFLDITVLAAELGGVAVAIKLLTGIGFPWWALPVGLSVWVLLWRGKFEAIEDGVAFLGLITLVFVVAAIKLHPDMHAVLAGLRPTLPVDKPAQYWFLAVSILGSLLSPYVLNFYSAGAVEEKWTADDLTANRLSAGLGMGFGGAVGACVLIACGAVLFPKGIDASTYEEMQLSLTVPLGIRLGATVFSLALGIATFGAALQVALNLSYTLAQALGWNWSEDLRPADDARFAATYTLAILAASIILAIGFDPLKITMLAMAFNVVVMPGLVLPLMMIMNDEDYLGPHTNGIVSNVVVSVVTVMGFILAVVSIPLQIVGGG